MKLPRTAMDALIAPRSIAVVGANPADTFRSLPLASLEKFGFAGTAYGISRRPVEGEHYPYFPRLADLPEVPDLAILGIAAQYMPDVVDECIALGVKAAIAFDGSLADGGASQAEMARKATNAGLALLGPNSQGLVNFTARTPAYFSQADAGAAPGRFALISASGSMLDAIAGNRRGIGWSHLIGTGNEAQLGAADFVEYFSADPLCGGIALFLETIRDVDSFMTACDACVAAGKPVIVLWAGKSEAAREAALAHTGALSPPEKLLNGLLHDHGITVVGSIEELLAAVAIYECGRIPRLTNFGLLSGSGGMIEMAQDAVEPLGIHFSDVSKETKNALRAIPTLGKTISCQNPIDWWPSDSLDVAGDLIKVFASDDDIAGVVSITEFYPGPSDDRPFHVLGYEATLRAAQSSGKLCLMLSGVDVPAPAVAEARRSGVAVVGGLQSGLRALDAVVRAASRKPRAADDPVLPRSLPEAAPFSGSKALALISDHATVVKSRSFATSEDPAAQFADLAFPIVLKSNDADDLHKTEDAKVYLNLADSSQAIAAFRELKDKGCKSVVAQPFVQGVELIVGIQRHPELGGFLMVGLGGIWAEILDDVVVRPLGVDRAGVEEMLRELKAYPLLVGARGKPSVDMAKLVDVICGVDRLGRALGSSIESIDCNPVIATPDTAIVVDALVVPSDR